MFNIKKKGWYTSYLKMLYYTIYAIATSILPAYYPQ